MACRSASASDQIREFDIRVLTMDLPSRQYLTVEKKPLDVDSYVAWRIRDVDQYYRATGGDELRARSLILSRVDNGLRDAFGIRTMLEVVSGQRDELMLQLRDLTNETAGDELGIEIVDVRVKAIEFPGQVSENVYRRMATEREKLAQEFRSRGQELAEGIRADADRQKVVTLANAFAEAEETRGQGDRQAAEIYANAYGTDQEFYSFYRSLQAYRNTFADKDDIMVIDSDSAFMRFLKDPMGAN
ncbi:MAG: protease modulator HflC [Marinobacter sp.]